MGAQLFEARVEFPELAAQHFRHGGGHVIVDAVAACAANEIEGAVVGLEDHLHGLAGKTLAEEKAAMAQAHVRHLDGHGQPADLQLLMAPVELIGLAWCKFQRHVGVRRLEPRLLPPTPYEPSHGVVATLVALSLKLLEQDLGRASVLLGLFGVVLQLLNDPIREPFHLRHGLHRAMIFKLGRVGPEDLADRVPAQVEVPGDLPNRLLVSAMGQLDLAYCLHRQHLLVFPPWRSVERP